MKRNKNFIKNLLLSLLSVSIISSAGIKAETLTINQLYTNAFNATKNALSLKTQKSINEARAALSQLPKKELGWAIGEFSKQIDKMQNQILSKVNTAINTAKAKPTQANINAAKAAIDKDMPDSWRRAYSSAVDTIQQNAMKSAQEAYNKAVQSKSQADVDAANLLASDIKSAKDVNIASWANSLQTKINSIEIPVNFGTLSRVTINMNDTPLNREIKRNAHNSYKYDVIYSNGSNVVSITPMDKSRLEQELSLPEIGTTEYANVYDKLLSNIVYNLYMSAAYKALNVTIIDTSHNPVSINLKVDGNNIIYTIWTNFYKKVEYIYTPQGDGVFDLNY